VHVDKFAAPLPRAEPRALQPPLRKLVSMRGDETAFLHFAYWFRAEKKVIMYSTPNLRFRVLTSRPPSRHPLRWPSFRPTIGVKLVRATSIGDAGLNFKLVDPALTLAISSPSTYTDPHAAYGFRKSALDFHPRLIYRAFRDHSSTGLPVLVLLCAKHGIK